LYPAEVAVPSTPDLKGPRVISSRTSATFDFDLCALCGFGFLLHEHRPWRRGRHCPDHKLLPFWSGDEPKNGNTATGYNKKKYLYNTKLKRSVNPALAGELQDDKMTSEALNWFDYGARMYDRRTGRWMTIDPLAEKYTRGDAYNYAVDNPIMYIDPDGKDVHTVNKNGNTVLRRKTKKTLIK
jgi:RHS repeat-associated protein